MRDPRRVYVQETELFLERRADLRAPGAAVTTALCGHWEHEGPCRWPHHNALTAEGGVRLRTVFVADPGDEATVRQAIALGLAGSRRWSVVSSAAAPLEDDEIDLAGRLRAGPHL